eukprot:30838-Pelagococcus_subviridis.AAC.2
MSPFVSPWKDATTNRRRPFKRAPPTPSPSIASIASISSSSRRSTHRTTNRSPGASASRASIASRVAAAVSSPRHSSASTSNRSFASSTTLFWSLAPSIASGVSTWYFALKTSCALNAATMDAETSWRHTTSADDAATSGDAKISHARAVLSLSSARTSPVLTPCHVATGAS